MSQLPTSVENMSPGQPFIRTLAASVIDPRITVHSIIAVLDEGRLTSRTDDVISCDSAYIEGVVSEKIVRSVYSTKGHPVTIEKTQHILREPIGAK